MYATVIVHGSNVPLFAGQNLLACTQVHLEQNWSRTKQLKCQGKLANSIPHCDLSSGNHLLYNQKCVSHYNNKQFSIFLKARSDFNLSVLKLIFITL